MRRSLRLLASIVCPVAALAACQSETDGQAPAPSQIAKSASASTAAVLNARSAPGSQVGMYKMSWPKVSPSERLSRVRTAAMVLAQKALPLVLADIPDREWVEPVGDAKLRARYEERFNEVHVRDEGATELGPAPADIGEHAARAQAATFLDELATAGFVGRGHYDIESAETGHMRGGRVGGGPQNEWTVEYRFKMFRKLNGIDVAGTRLTLGISPTGRRSSLRHGGLRIESTGNGLAEAPAASGHMAIRRVPHDEITRRFNEEVEAGERKLIQQDREMYILPEDVTEAVVGPRRVVAYSRTMKTRDGQQLFEPVRTIGFSLTEPQKPFEDFSSPSERAPGGGVPDSRRN